MVDRPQQHGTFPVPNSLVDQWLPDLKDTEQRLLLVIIRQTAGFLDPNTGMPKTRDWLSQSRLKKATGRAEGPLARAIASLVAQGLIVAEDELGRALETAAMRRRHLRRIYYRLGPALSSPFPGDTPALKPKKNPSLLNVAKSVFPDAQSAAKSEEAGIPRPQANAERALTNAAPSVHKVHITNKQHKIITQMHFVNTERMLTAQNLPVLSSRAQSAAEAAQIENTKAEIRARLAQIRPNRL